MKGSTLIELLVAIALVGVVLLAMGAETVGEYNQRLLPQHEAVFSNCIDSMANESTTQVQAMKAMKAIEVCEKRADIEVPLYD